MILDGYKNMNKKKHTEEHHKILQNEHMMLYYKQAIYYPEILEVLKVHFSKMIRICLKLYSY